LRLHHRLLSARLMGIRLVKRNVFAKMRSLLIGKFRKVISRKVKIFCDNTVQQNVPVLINPRFRENFLSRNFITTLTDTGKSRRHTLRE
jgi:hypothetical protein